MILLILPFITLSQNVVISQEITPDSNHLEISSDHTSSSTNLVISNVTINQGEPLNVEMKFYDAQDNLINATFEFTNAIGIFGTNPDQFLNQQSRGIWEFNKNRTDGTIPGKYTINVTAYPVQGNFDIGTTIFTVNVISTDTIKPLVNEFSINYNTTEGEDYPDNTINLSVDIQDNKQIRTLRLLHNDHTFLILEKIEGSEGDFSGLTYNQTHITGNVTYPIKQSEGVHNFSIIIEDYGFNTMIETIKSTETDVNGPQITDFEILNQKDEYQIGDEFTISWEAWDTKSSLQEAILEIDGDVIAAVSATQENLSINLPQQENTQNKWTYTFYITDVYDHRSEKVTGTINKSPSNSTQSDQLSSVFVPSLIILAGITSYRAYYYRRKS